VECQLCEYLLKEYQQSQLDVIFLRKQLRPTKTTHRRWIPQGKDQKQHESHIKPSKPMYVHAAGEGNYEQKGCTAGWSEIQAIRG